MSVIIAVTALLETLYIDISLMFYKVFANHSTMMYTLHRVPLSSNKCDI